MCGIAGIVDFEVSNEALRNKAQVMIDALKHRGPNSTGGIKKSASLPT